ncbi:MAG: BON domain-containing protein [Acidimicrobiia bacterium]
MNKATMLRSAGIGATAAMGAYLLDPDMGRTRRAKLADQSRALARKVADRTEARARYQQGVARGALHTLSRPFRPRIEIDDDTLLQKVRSEALGPWSGRAQGVEVDIDNGIVTLTGSAEPASVDELIHRVERVDGVGSVVNRIGAVSST